MIGRCVSQLATCSDDMTVRLWRVDRARAQAHRDVDHTTDVDDFLGTAEEAPVFSPRRSPRRSPLRPTGSGTGTPQRAAPGQLGAPHVTVSPSLLQRTPSPPLWSSQSSYTSTPSPVRPANVPTMAVPRARRALFAEPPPTTAAAASATTTAARRRASDDTNAGGPAKRTRQLRVDELVSLSRPSSAPLASDPATAAA